MIASQVTTDSARTNIIDNYVLEGADVQNNNLDRLYIGNRSGGRNRAYVRFATIRYCATNVSKRFLRICVIII